MLFRMLQLWIKDATTPPLNDDEQFNELFDNLMEKLTRSEEDDAEYEDLVSNSEDVDVPEKVKHSKYEDKVDYIIDEDKNIQDINMDMANFILNVHSDMEGGCVNDVHVGDEPEDMEVINNEEFDSLDEGSDQDRQRRALIKNLGKEKRCGLRKIHNLSFAIGQKFKSKKELKEQINIHALETRRNLFF
uniref:Uncharacterized protein n=1 Tax=Lactuca sativa TaxID=4236 RepID=A0A9R1VNY2_LACSA|nr:hypothetical protein LSAT_V11C400208350 [Lactuca sativa]